MTTLTQTPSMNIPTIQPGCFLVLHGKQGSGKTTIAKRIASSRGKFSEISSRHLCEPEALAYALSSSPSTLIIDDEGFLKKDLAQLKFLVTTKQVNLRKPYSREQEKMAAPLVIVCSQNAQQFAESRRAQRFNCETAGMLETLA